jgi:putative ABC transport system permease protein
MLSHYLLTLYRSLSRHRLYAAINVLGLALGIAVFLVLMLVVRFETCFERWIPDAPQVYAVRTHTAAEGWFPYTMGDLLDELRADYPQIIGARVQHNSGVVRRNGTFTSETVSDVDPSLFQVLDLPRIAGDPTRWLRTPDEVVITAAKAKQYFGTVSSIGQTLTLDHRGEVQNLRVVGVIKDPPQTTEFKFGLLVPLKIPTPEAYPRWRRWGAMDVETYLRLPTAAQADALNGQMDAFVDRHNIHAVNKPAHKALSLRLTPLVAMHLIVPPAVAVVTAIAVVAVLTLLLAAVNYINLATARAALRAREVAVRKVLGATVQGLIRQFLGEAVVTVALAALLGLALCELTLPLIDAMLGIGLKLDYLGDPWLLGTMATVIIALGLGAGVYPAFVLSRFQPAAVLASARSPGGGRAGARLREALVIFQFAVAIAFTIGMGVILSQAHYLRRVDLGFTRAGLIEIDSFPHDGVSAAQRASLLDAWRALPGIVSVTQSDSAPGNSDTPISPIRRPGATADLPPIHEATIGPDFFETYGAHLVAGRWPDRRHGADFPATPAPDASQQPAANLVVNLLAVKLLGFKTPQEAIGQRLIEGRTQTPRFTIIGVVSDLRFASPRAPLEPIVYLPDGGDIGGGLAVVRYADPDPSAVMARLAATWRAIVPTQPFEAKTMVAELEPNYRADDQVSRLLTLAAALSVAIGCIGLYGLAAFNTARRVREIGIRKTLGASTGDILTLLIGQFLRPVLIANLAAWPLAYLAMRAYLAGFDQRISLSPLYFAAATAITLLIAVATVGGQAYAVARAEPARALRCE